MIINNVAIITTLDNGYNSTASKFAAIEENC